MTLSLRQMRTLVAVSRTGSLGKAAAELHLTQPALTVQLREAEANVGFRLFDRGARGAQITDAGGIFIAELERILAELDVVTENAKDVAARRAGIVRVAVLPTVGATIIPHALSVLRKESPRIRVVVRDAVAARLTEMIKSGEVEIGIGTPIARETELKIIALSEDHLVAVLPPQHSFEALATVQLSDLASESLILMDNQSSSRVMFDDACFAQQISVSPAYQATYMSTAIGLVRAGLGIAILPSTAIDLKIPPLLETRPISSPEIIRKIFIMSRLGRSISPAAEAFVDAVRAEIAESGKNS